jgi:hypothetical protein
VSENRNTKEEKERTTCCVIRIIGDGFKVSKAEIVLPKQQDRYLADL